ncbi:MAG TPA: hypothetical protein PKA64_14880, partial [Myxococcota bacterium]|nr:hypothetical protein [Myxococcota bacterium]
VPGAPGLTRPGLGSLAPAALIEATAALYGLGDLVFDVGDVDGDGRGDPLLTVADGNTLRGGFALY